ncbi:hypothetical protein Ocin01_18727 [Orchesella cincta]|uniref:Uncharacterized protein n=1 Tax=Orchesella cincta TaxID=48709 RepID=A0A1D2M4Q7_ORCCI|nr:hypothetical protein Ocin01_18727 [Orchesella cincta]
MASTLTPAPNFIALIQMVENMERETMLLMLMALLWANQNGSSDLPKFARGGCSLGDVFLSIIFHCGLWIPAPVWDILTQYFGIGPVDPPPKAAGSRLSKVTFAVLKPSQKCLMSVQRHLLQGRRIAITFHHSLVVGFHCPPPPDLKVELVNDAARPGSKALKLDERDSISTVEMEMNQMLPSSQPHLLSKLRRYCRIN